MKILKRAMIINSMVLALGLAGTAHAADTVFTLDITAPTGTQYFESFPATVDVSLEISAVNGSGTCQTNAIKEIKVEATHDDITEVIHDNTTTPIFDNAPQVCPVGYTFTWSGIQPGTYQLVVTITKGNDDGTVDESVEFLEAALEYNAPPAVANAFIKTNCNKLTGGARGAIISEIAHRFSTDEYNPKPGPYSGALIRSDVVELSGGACHE